MKQQKLLVAVLVALSSMSAMAATTVATTTPTTAACVPQTTLTQMQAELAGLLTAKATALKPLQDKLALTNQTLSTAQATLTQKRAALTAAQTELTTAQNRILQIQALLGTSGTASTATNYTANLTGEIAALKTQVASIQQRIAGMTASEATAAKGFEVEKADLTAQLAKLKATVVAQPVMAIPLFKNPSEVYAWVSAERAKSDAAVKFNGEIARVQALIARDDAQIARVHADFAIDRVAAETEITRLNRSIELLNVAVAQLSKFQQVDTAKLKAELDTLLGRVQTLKAQIPAMQTSVSAAEAAVKEIQNTVNALNAQITQVSTDYDNRYAKLKAYLATLVVCK